MRTPGWWTGQCREGCTYNESMGRVVAVVGASSRRESYGNMAVRAFVRQGYVVIPINPHATEIEGLRAYPSVIDVPGTIDLATLYVPPAIGINVLDELVRKRISEVWLNPGADGPAIEQRARALGLVTVVDCSLRRIGMPPGAW